MDDAQFNVIQQSQLSKAQAMAEQWTPEMLVWFSDWCTMKAKEKALMPAAEPEIVTGTVDGA